METAITRRTVLAASAAMIAAQTGLGAQTMADMKTQSISAKATDGVVLSGTIQGPKGAPELLLIHGLGQSRLSWELQISALSDRFRIAAFDMRGHGDSDKPLDPDAYADADRWGDDIHAMIEAAALDRPTLVGWSFGGLVLGHYLRRHGAENIRGLALVCAVTKFAPELFGPKGLALGAGLSSSDLAVRAEAIVDTVRAITAKPLPTGIFDRTVAVNGMAPRALQLGYGRTDPNGLDAAFARPKRLLAMYGSKDQITLPGMATRLAQVNPAARIVEFKDSGHAPHYDETDRFNRELAGFAS